MAKFFPTELKGSKGGFGTIELKMNIFLSVVKDLSKMTGADLRLIAHAQLLWATWFDTVMVSKFKPRRGV